MYMQKHKKQHKLQQMGGKGNLKPAPGKMANSAKLAGKKR